MLNNGERMENEKLDRLIAINERLAEIEQLRGELRKEEDSLASEYDSIQDSLKGRD